MKVRYLLIWIPMLFFLLFCYFIFHSSILFCLELFVSMLFSILWYAAREYILLLNFLWVEYHLFLSTHSAIFLIFSPEFRFFQPRSWNGEDSSSYTNQYIQARRYSLVHSTYLCPLVHSTCLYFHPFPMLKKVHTALPFTN